MKATSYHEVQNLLLEILRRISAGAPKRMAWEHAEELLRNVLRATAQFQNKRFSVRGDRRIAIRIMAMKKRASRELWECCGTPHSEAFFKNLADMIRASLEISDGTTS